MPHLRQTLAHQRVAENYPWFADLDQKNYAVNFPVPRCSALQAWAPLQHSMDRDEISIWQWAFVLIGYPGIPSLDSGSATGPCRDGSYTTLTSVGIYRSTKFSFTSASHPMLSVVRRHAIGCAVRIRTRFVRKRTCASSMQFIPTNPPETASRQNFRTSSGVSIAKSQNNSVVAVLC